MPPSEFLGLARVPGRPVLKGLQQPEPTLPCVSSQLEMELKMLQSQSGPAEQSVLLSREEVSALRYVACPHQHLFPLLPSGRMLSF